MIRIPESVAFYWDDPVNRAALNILQDLTEVPADLSLDEAERFELAALAARRVRVDYWLMMRELWAAVWGEAVRAQLPSARLLGYGGHGNFAATAGEVYADPSVAHAWAEAGHCGVFELPGNNHLFTAVWLTEDEREIQLQFYVVDADQSCAISDGLELGADWADDGESRRETRGGCFPLAKGPTGLDHSAASQCASDAIHTFTSVLA